MRETQRSNSCNDCRQHQEKTQSIKTEFIFQAEYHYSHIKCKVVIFGFFILKRNTVFSSQFVELPQKVLSIFNSVINLKNQVRNQ